MNAKRYALFLLVASASVAVVVSGALRVGGWFTETLLVTVPIWCTALSARICLEGGLYNLGAEGQLYAGAAASAAAAWLASSTIAAINNGLAVVALLLSASLAGAAFGGLAGVGKAWWGTHEAVVTLMLNFIAIALARFLAAGPLEDPDSFGYPWTAPIPAWMRLGSIVASKQIPAGLAVAASAAVLYWLLLFHTLPGLRLRAMGSNPQAAVMAGVDLGRTAILALAAGGALAGLGGGLELVGHQLRLSPFFSPAYGFTGLVAAVVAGSSPVALAGSAFLLAALRTSLQTAERLAGLPSVISFIVQGGVLLIAAVAAGGVELESRRLPPKKRQTKRSLRSAFATREISENSDEDDSSARNHDIP